MFLIIFTRTVNAQTDSLITRDLFFKDPLINLSRSHNPSDDSVTYVLDFLKLDKHWLQRIQLTKNDLKSVKIRNANIIIETRLPILFNGKLLLKKAEKRENLYLIMPDKIKSIIKSKETKAYGKIGKNGILIIETQQPNCPNWRMQRILNYPMI